MCVDELLGGLICFLFLAERFKESLQMLWEMGALNRQEWGEERVARNLHWICEVSSKVLCESSKAVQRKRIQHRDFDPTKGFPGEDLQPEIVFDLSVDFSASFGHRSSGL